MRQTKTNCKFGQHNPVSLGRSNCACCCYAAGATLKRQIDWPRLSVAVKVRRDIGNGC